MFKYIFVSALLFVKCLHANDIDPENHRNAHLLPNTCGGVGVRRVADGPPGLYEFPWMALIEFKTSKGPDFLCTGTIVNSRYILTAATCMSQNNKISGVRVGEFNKCTAQDCHGGDCESHIQDILVENEIPHVNYVTNPNIDNNIALLRLKEPINFSFKNVAPICLPVSSTLRNTSLEGKTAIIASWKLKLKDCQLHRVNLPLLSRNECQKKYDERARSLIKISAKQICAVEQAKDACDFTSGDPLMLESSHQGGVRMVQYAISSHGISKCGEAPGVYTDVSKYVSWILDNMKE